MGSGRKRNGQTAIGRRGLLLVLSGLAWALTGTQMLLGPHRTRFSSGHSDYLLILHIMDSHLWGWLWLICGLGAVIVGIFRRREPFHGRDEIGFNLVCTPVVVWTLFFALSWVLSLLSDGLFGQSTASYGLVVWGLISAFIMTIAGWPEGVDETNAEKRSRDDRDEAQAQNTARHRSPK